MNNPQFTERDQTMLSELHKAIFGNGHPENSLLARMANMEKLMRGILWIAGVAMSAVVVIAVNQIFGG